MLCIPDPRPRIRSSRNEQTCSPACCQTVQWCRRQTGDKERGTDDEEQEAAAAHASLTDTNAMRACLRPEPDRFRGTELDRSFLRSLFSLSILLFILSSQSSECDAVASRLRQLSWLILSASTLSQYQGYAHWIRHHRQQLRQLRSIHDSKSCSQNAGPSIRQATQ